MRVGGTVWTSVCSEPREKVVVGMKLGATGLELVAQTHEHTNQMPHLALAALAQGLGEKIGLKF